MKQSNGSGALSAAMCLPVRAVAQCMLAYREEGLSNSTPVRKTRPNRSEFSILRRCLNRGNQIVKVEAVSAVEIFMDDILRF